MVGALSCLARDFLLQQHLPLSGARYRARDTTHKQPIQYATAHIRALYPIRTLNRVYSTARPKSGVTARVCLIFTTERRNLLLHSVTKKTDRLHHNCEIRHSLQQLRHVGDQDYKKAITTRVFIRPSQLNLMDIPDTGEAPPPAAETSFIDDQEHSVATNDDRGPIHPHFSVPTRPITTLPDVVDTFISNTKVSCCHRDMPLLSSHSFPNI